MPPHVAHCPAGPVVLPPPSGGGEKTPRAEKLEKTMRDGDFDKKLLLQKTLLGSASQAKKDYGSAKQVEEPREGGPKKKGCLGRALDVVAVMLFNFWLVLLLVPVWLAAVCGRCVVCCFPRCQPCLAHVLIGSASLSWRAVLGLCCWISVDAQGLHEFREHFSSDRPFVLLSNHTSFLDTILSVSFLPLARAGRVKMLAANNIFRMPLLGFIVRAMGHLEVPFQATKTDDASMAVDSDAMNEQMQKLEAHLLSGNTAAWFAEGRMNLGDNRQVQIFRAGGFALPVHVDSEVWCVGYVGNSVCWPPLSKAGGYPAKIGCKISRLCESSHAFLAAECPGDDEREKMIYLANAAQRKVQAHVEELVAAGYSIDPPAETAASDLLSHASSSGTTASDVVSDASSSSASSSLAEP